MTIWNRTRAKAEPLAAKGGKIVDKPVDLAGCDVVFAIVSTGKDVEQVVFGKDGLLSGAKKPKMLVDCSSISVEESAAIRKRLTERGVSFLAAPVSGNAKVIKAGKLSSVVSGPEADAKVAMPLIEVFAPQGVSYVGDGDLRVHLGSWRRGAGGESVSYREAADQLAEYCGEIGFTHVEFMPLAEHPFGGSWGYQVSSYYAPTSRYGSPDDLRHLVDRLHQRGIGVIMDWVPAHFPKDEWALAHFDGTALYEHSDPRLGEHPDWGTLVFNYGRNEVRNFLVSNARYWIEEFHIDGLRVDAVASMLYLDYSRKEGQWVPNRYGGRENLEAVAMLREMTHMVGEEFAGVLSIAEESTAWPGVSRPVEMGGLGFSRKWNMGWMHDTLDYFSHDPVYRRYHHHKLTFGLIYAWSERFVLPISHDEVVHGKGSLLRKMPGDEWRKFANLRALLAWMWAHPGNKLLFMGSEIAQRREWAHDDSLDWDLLEDPKHAGVQHLVRDLNAGYQANPTLWQRDFAADGFRWLDAGNADQNIVSFLRYDGEGRCGLCCVANFSPMPRDNFRVGLPHAGFWKEILNTDATTYGGTNTGNMGGVTAEADGWHGQPFSAAMTLPPLGVLWFAPGEPGAGSTPG